MYDQIMVSQKGAAGSAIEENEEYMKSFEARLAATRRSVEELALSLGDAFLNEAMIQGIKAFSEGLQIIASQVDKVGALPLVFSVLGVALLTVSKNARGWAQALAFGTKEMQKNTRELLSLKEGMTRAEVASQGFARTWRSVFAGLGITAGLAIAGFALEKLMSKMAETRQRAEEMKNQIAGQRREYEANADGIKKLTDEYDYLENKLKNSTLSEKERVQTTEKMLAVQEELAQIMPSIVTAEDEFGNKTYATAQSIKLRNEMMEHQIRLEEQRERMEEQAGRIERFKQQEKDVKAYNKEFEKSINLAQQWLQVGTFAAGEKKGFLGIDIEDAQSANQAINELSKLRSELYAQGETKKGDEVGKAINEIIQQVGIMEIALNGAESASFGMLETISQTFNEFLQNTGQIGEETKSLLTGITMIMHEAGVSAEDAQKMFNGLRTTIENDDIFAIYAKNYEDMLTELEEAKERYNLTPDLANEEALQAATVKATNAYKNMIAQIIEILKKSGITDTNVLNTIADKFEQNMIRMLADSKTFEEIAEITGQSIEEVQLALQALGEEEVDIEFNIDSEGAIQKINDLVTDLTEYGFTLEGVTEQEYLNAKALEESIRLKQESGEATDDLDFDTRQLIEAYEGEQRVLEQLKKLFPDIILGEDAAKLSKEELIAKIEEELLAQDLLIGGMELVANGQVTSEEHRTITNFKNTRARIQQYREELAALKTLASAMDAIRGMQTNLEGQLQDAIAAGDKDLQDRIGKQLMRFGAKTASYDASGTTQKLLDKEIQLNSALEDQSKQMKSLQRISGILSNAKSNLGKQTDRNTKANKGNSKAKKDNKKATKENAKEEELASFIADKYKRAMEELNVVLKAQQAIKSQFPKHSKEYQDALKNELQLEQQRLKLMQNQTAELQKAYKAGKAPQTGVVSAKQQQQPKVQTQTTNRKLSGWQAPVNSQFGMRWGRMHEGVDIAQAKGTRLDANVAGIVKRAMNHKTYGNVVYVVDNSGKEHRYAHLNNINVKQGQRVNVGDQLGAIGSTGRSTGPHLHYEVRVNGKAVNPMDFVKSAKGNKAITTQVNQAMNVSKDVAQATANVYDLQSDILDLQGNIIDQQVKIAELQAEMIRAELAIFDKRRATYGYHMDYESTKYEQIAKSSERYLNVLERQSKQLYNKQLVNREEIVHLEKMINSGKLHGNVLEEMTQRYFELKTEISNTNTELWKMNEQKIEAQLYHWALATEAYDFEMAKLEQTIRNTVEGSQQWLSAMEQKSQYLTSQRSAIKQEINQITELLKVSNLLTPEAVENYERRLRALTLEYRELGLSLGDLNKQTQEVIKGEKSAWDEIANNIIATYKKAMEQKRDAHMKSLDDEMKREDERHKQAIKNLQDELSEFKKVIDERIKALDDEANEESYRKEISELEKERKKILDKVNLISMDDSREAKYERKKLQEELSKIDETIEDKRSKREREKRKENLQEMLSDKEEDIKEREELENKQHDSEKERIDDLKAYWDKYYTDRMNDERMFAQWRKDLANGEYEHILELFDDLAIELEGTLEDITDTLGGTMEGVGTAIRQNVIDELRRAIELAREFNDTVSGTTSGGTGLGSDLSSGLNSSGEKEKQKSIYHTSDYQVLTGKLMRHNLSKFASSKEEEHAIKLRGSNLAEGGRKKGSQIDGKISYNEMVSSLNDTDIVEFIDHLTKYKNGLSAQDYQMKDWIDREIQRLKLSASYDTGGLI